MRHYSSVVRTAISNFPVHQCFILPFMLHTSRLQPFFKVAQTSFSLNCRRLHGTAHPQLYSTCAPPGEILCLRRLLGTAHHRLHSTCAPPGGIPCLCQSRYYLLYGHECRLPLDQLLPRPKFSGARSLDYTVYAEELTQRLHSAHPVTLTQQVAAQSLYNRQKAIESIPTTFRPREHKSFNIGDLVML